MSTFVHPALLYADPVEYLAGTIPFIQGGLDGGEPVMVAVPGDNLDLIRSALGVDAKHVVLRDMGVAGRNPGRIIPAVLLAFAAEHAGKPVRVIGEPVWAGRSAAEYPACAQHEALINAAFRERDAAILCPYDTSRLDPVWLADAYRTHPVMWTPTARWDSPHYTDPYAVAASFAVPLGAAPAGAATIEVRRGTLAAIRRFAADRAREAGLHPDRVDDLTIAVSELAANSVVHADGGTLAVWTEDGQLLCQVDDTGHIDDPLAGRVPVAADEATGGRGLLLVNQLCDLVRMHSRPGATSVRLYLRLG